jgi:hypothetical protein
MEIQDLSPGFPLTRRAHHSWFVEDFVIYFPFSDLVSHDQIPNQ